MTFAAWEPAEVDMDVDVDVGVGVLSGGEEAGEGERS